MRSDSEQIGVSEFIISWASTPTRSCQAFTSTASRSLETPCRAISRRAPAAAGREPGDPAPAWPAGRPAARSRARPSGRVISRSTAPGPKARDGRNRARLGAQGGPRGAIDARDHALVVDHQQGGVDGVGQGLQEVGPLLPFRPGRGEPVEGRLDGAPPARRGHAAWSAVRSPPRSGRRRTAPAPGRPHGCCASGPKGPAAAHPPARTRWRRGPRSPAARALNASTLIASARRPAPSAKPARAGERPKGHAARSCDRAPGG